MRGSDERILTTHVGSLPRDPALSDLLIREELGETVDRAELLRLSEAAVRDVVRQQAACGVDVINDGEQPRVGFQTYVAQRMKGFGGEIKRPRGRDYSDFPIFGAWMLARMPRRSKVSNAPQAIADVVYDDLGAAEHECRLFRAALEDLATPPTETFMTAPSPGIIATTLLNAHYHTHQAYVFALARQTLKEYQLIVRDGFELQIDAALAMERHAVPGQDRTRALIAEMHGGSQRRWQAFRASESGSIAGEQRIAAHARHPAGDILPVLTQASVGALSIEFANPRHRTNTGSRRLAGAGVLLSRRDRHHDNFVEHPEVVANRICEAVDGGTARHRFGDCGFGTRAMKYRPHAGRSSELPRRRRHRHPAPVGR